MPRAYQLTLLAVIVTATVSCRDQDAFARRSEQFEVVTEGSARGVTSTVVAPGETPAPLLPVLPPSITDTNVDTTTSFTILDATSSTSGTVQPGTLADILPNEQDRPRPRPAPRPSPPPPTTEPAQPSEPTQPAPAPPAEPPSEDKPSEPLPTPPTTSTSTAPPNLY